MISRKRQSSATSPIASAVDDSGADSTSGDSPSKTRALHTALTSDKEDANPAYISAAEPEERPSFTPNEPSGAIATRPPSDVTMLSDSELQISAVSPAISGDGHPPASTSETVPEMRDVPSPVSSICSEEKSPSNPTKCSDIGSRFTSKCSTNADLQFVDDHFSAPTPDEILLARTPLLTVDTLAKETPSKSEELPVQDSVSPSVPPTGSEQNGTRLDGSTADQPEEMETEEAGAYSGSSAVGGNVKAEPSLMVKNLSESELEGSSNTALTSQFVAVVESAPACITDISSTSRPLEADFESTPLNNPDFTSASSQPPVVPFAPPGSFVSTPGTASCFLPPQAIPTVSIRTSTCTSDLDSSQATQDSLFGTPTCFSDISSSSTPSPAIPVAPPVTPVCNAELESTFHRVQYSLAETPIRFSDISSCSSSPSPAVPAAPPGTPVCIADTTRCSPQAQAVPPAPGTPLCIRNLETSFRATHVSSAGTPNITSSFPLLHAQLTASAGMTMCNGQFESSSRPSQESQTVPVGTPACVTDLESPHASRVHSAGTLANTADIATSHTSQVSPATMVGMPVSAENRLSSDPSHQFPSDRTPVHITSLTSTSRTSQDQQLIAPVVSSSHAPQASPAAAVVTPMSIANVEFSKSASQTPSVSTFIYAPNTSSTSNVSQPFSADVFVFTANHERVSHVSPPEASGNSMDAVLSKLGETGDNLISPKKKMEFWKEPFQKTPKQNKCEDLYTEKVCAAASGNCAVALKLALEARGSGSSEEGVDSSEEDGASADETVESYGKFTEKIEVDEGEKQASGGSESTEGAAVVSAGGEEKISSSTSSDSAKPLDDITLMDVEKMSEHSEDRLTDATDDSKFDGFASSRDFNEDCEEGKSAEENSKKRVGTAARTTGRTVTRRRGPAAQLMQAMKLRDDLAAAQLVSVDLFQMAPGMCNRVLAIAAAFNMAETVRRLLQAGANPLWREPGQEGPGAGQTAAHRAAETAAFEALSALREEYDKPQLLARAADVLGDTPLHIAARLGDTRSLRLLLSVVADVQLRNADEETPLLSAAAGGHLVALQLLLNAGAAVNAVRKGGRTPLHVAAFFRHSAVVLALTAAGADVDAEDDDGNTPLLLAVDRDASLVLVQLLVHKGADVNHANNNGVTPAHAAAAQRSELTLDVLLAFGARPEVGNAEGCMPLNLSAFTAQKPKFEVLLHLTPNPVNRRTLSGCTIFHSAVLGGDLETVQTTVSLGADVSACTTVGDTALHLAASTGHATVLRYLLSLGLNVNSRALSGATPLHYASNAEVVDVLRGAGADLYALTNLHETPLCRAAASGYAEVLRRLAPLYSALETVVDLPDHRGWSPLQIAAFNGCEDAALELVRIGADVHVCSSTSPSPLMSAAHHGLQRAVEALVEAGARAHRLQPMNHHSPLHEAVRCGREKILETLVRRAGADVNQKDGNYGHTPLHIAALCENTNIVSQLIAFGANPRVVDALGKSPLHYFRRFCKLRCLKKLSALARMPFGAQTPTRAPGVGLVAGQTDEVAEARKFLRDLEMELKRPCMDGRKRTMHVCCMFGFAQQVRELLLLGDNPSMPIAYRLRPLHFAAAHGHVEVINILLDAGVDIEARRDNGCTALHEAALHGRSEAVRELLRRGAHPRPLQASGRTAAHLAATQGYIGCLMELAGAPHFDVNDRDCFGISLLHCAARSGNALLVRKLVQKGALIEARDKSGRSPLFHAVFRGESETITELIDLGADPQARDNSGTSPVDYARNHPHLRNVYGQLLELVEGKERHLERPSAHFSLGNTGSSRPLDLTCHDRI